MDRINGLDRFTELPVSLVLFALICVDVIERIRPCKLLGSRKSAGSFLLSSIKVEKEGVRLEELIYIDDKCHDSF